jgi:hypothetical protein
MTIQSPGFYKPHPPSARRTGTLQASARLVLASILTAVASGLLLIGCAAELEEQEAYTTRVLPGVGASGVTAARGVAPNQVEPGVQPAVSPQGTADVEPGGTSENSSSVAPSPSVAPASEVSPSAGVSAECADVPTRILQGKCAGPSCHGSPGMPTQFFSDIASSTDPGHLLNVPAKAPCQSKMLIDGDNPADSAILSAVQAADHCSGGQMPSGGPYLTDDEIRCLTEWVNAAATGAI